jgi:hypothetical protein
MSGPRSTREAVQEALDFLAKVEGEGEAAVFIFVDPAEADPASFFYGNIATAARAMRALVEAAEHGDPGNCKGCRATQEALKKARTTYHVFMQSLTGGKDLHEHGG